MIEAIIGWNLWAIPLGGYAIYKIWQKAPTRKTEEKTEDKVVVKRHYRRKPRQTENEREFQKFKKNHMRGLKANNPTRYARKMRLNKLTERRDSLADKCEYYYRLGEFEKAERAGREAAKLDNEINRVRL